MPEARSRSKSHQHPETLDPAKGFLTSHAQATLRSSSSKRPPPTNTAETAESPSSRFLHALQALLRRPLVQTPRLSTQIRKGPISQPGITIEHTLLRFLEIYSPLARPTNS
ncbi:hypothetical protein ACFX13_018978 [Malus domestica]